MKKYKVILYVLVHFLLFMENVQAQNGCFSTLHFELKNVLHKPIVTDAVFYDAKTKEKVVIKCDELGKGTVKLQCDHTYSLWIPIADNKYDFEIPNYNNYEFAQIFEFDNSRKNEPHANPIEAYITFKIRSALKGPVSTTFKVRSEDKTFSQTLTSTSDGNVSVLLPIDKKYLIDFDGATSYSSVTVPNQAFYMLDKTIQYEPQSKHPTETIALINLYYVDFSNKRVPNETFIIKDSKTQKEYSAVTDTSGRAQILVPIGATYILGIPTNPNFAIRDIPAIPKKYTIELEYKDITTVERERRKKEMIAIAEKAETDWKIKQIEIQKQLDKENKEWEQTIADNKRKAKEIQDEWIRQEAKQKRTQDSIERAIFISDSTIASQRKLEKKRIIAQSDSISRANLKVQLANYKKKRMQDSLRFVEANKPKSKEELRRDSIQSREQFIVATARNEIEKDRWGNDITVFRVMKKSKAKKRLIIVDFTGSMTPHAKILKNWFVLNYTATDFNTIVFFNDGDNKETRDKVIGKTGGIYSCDSCDINNVENIMSLSYRYNGGDIPENDLEAIITALKRYPRKYDEVVLVADNNSPVRDISLLDKVTLPIKVIICGVQDKINEDLLKIADKTKGSIYTIDQEVENLSSKVINNKITIGKYTYTKVGENFVRMD